MIDRKGGEAMQLYEADGYVPDCIRAKMQGLVAWDGKCHGCEFSRNPRLSDGGCYLADKDASAKRVLTNLLRFRSVEEVAVELRKIRAAVASWEGLEDGQS